MKNCRRLHRGIIVLCAVIFSCILLWGASHIIFAKDKSKHITIVYTNDTLGTLQPCGCGGNNTGGVIRRATYIKSVLAEDPNAIIVESGDLAFGVNPTQPTAQLEAVANAFKYMNYAAVGVGPVDLRLNDKYYETLNKIGIPVVNVGLTEHDGAFPYIIKEINGVKVGIVSFGAVVPEQRNNFDLMKKRYQALSEAAKASDVLILLDQGNIASNEWLERNGERLGTPDIVIGGAVRMPLSEPQWVGKTMVVPTSSQGAYVGRIDIEINGDEKKLTYTRKAIDPAIEENPDVKQIVDDYIKSQKVSTRNGSSTSAVEAPQPYYPYQSCVSCHGAEFEQWKTTPHAKALGTLLTQEKAIPDCLPCHSDMYKRAKRVVVNADQIGGVECIACHEEVLPHGPDMNKKDDPAKIKSRCITCHTKERSPDFDLDKYYEAVRHK